MIRKWTANDKLENEKGISVVAFSAEWCPPCKVMAPIYEEAAERFSGLTFLKADQEVTPEIFVNLGVHAIPTYLVLKDGKEVHRQVGAIPASKFQKMIEGFT